MICYFNGHKGQQEEVEENCMFTLKEREKALGAGMDVYTSQPIRGAGL